MHCMFCQMIFLQITQYMQTIIMVNYSLTKVMFYHHTLRFLIFNLFCPFSLSFYSAQKICLKCSCFKNLTKTRRFEKARVKKKIFKTFLIIPSGQSLPALTSFVIGFSTTYKSWVFVLVIKVMSYSLKIKQLYDVALPFKSIILHLSGVVLKL